MPAVVGSEQSGLVSEAFKCKISTWIQPTNTTTSGPAEDRRLHAKMRFDSGADLYLPSPGVSTGSDNGDVPCVM